MVRRRTPLVAGVVPQGEGSAIDVDEASLLMVAWSASEEVVRALV